ncbi:MAG: YitT family protein, partial [Columbia Basin potato purple top phytoplasma]
TSSCIKIGSSTGGIDIIAKYLSIYKQKSISLYINILNYSIAIFSVLFVYLYKNEFNLDSLILTFIKLIINSCVIYFILDQI